MIITEENQSILKDVIYEKTHKCPLCGKEIKQKVIKGSKNRLVKTDIDLNAYYDKVNPLYYEVIVCTECGFAQLSKREEMPTLAEADLIKKAICSKFNGRKYSEYYTAEDAVDRYKLALLNAIVRNALEGEKAYIALKLAWVYRNMGDEAQEKRFIGEALKGFINAYQREGFPIFELQEEVVCYLIAALSYEMDNDQQAIKWLQIVLRNKEISHKLKDRCFELKQMVSAREREKKKAEAEQT